MHISRCMLIQIWCKLWLNYQRWHTTAQLEGFNLKGWGVKCYGSLFLSWVSNYNAVHCKCTKADTGLSGLS